jgi:hypothetical protein
MNTFGLGPVVRVVNRVRDADGQPVVFKAMVGGESLKIVETLDLPHDIARLVIHQSMFRIDPVTHQPTHRLGCKALGVPEDPVSLAEVESRGELIDRDLLPAHRQDVKRVRIHNPIRRMDPLKINAPRPGDNGAYPGEFIRD